MEIEKVIKETVIEFLKDADMTEFIDCEVLTEDQAMEYLKVDSRDQMLEYRKRYGLKSLRTRPPKYIRKDLREFVLSLRN